MLYFQKNSSPEVSKIIKSFWLIDGEDDNVINQEKIIPDGYPEMVFHYRKPYRSNINGVWSLQSKYIIAGQIRNHFFLKNTGELGMFAIKFQPWALKTLFDIDMDKLTDSVISINLNLFQILTPIIEIATDTTSFEKKVAFIENWFLDFLSDKTLEESKGKLATQFIIKKNGADSIEQVQKEVGIGERALERYFNNHIGLSPKFYSRVIRFTYIFKLVQESDKNWSKITYQAGFYDQSHFIKNFKEFTGEDPSNYGFSKNNLANFFLRK